RRSHDAGGLGGALWTCLAHRRDREKEIRSQECADAGTRDVSCLRSRLWLRVDETAARKSPGKEDGAPIHGSPLTSVLSTRRTFHALQEKPDHRRKQQLQRRHGLEEQIWRPYKHYRDHPCPSAQEEERDEKPYDVAPALDRSDAPKERHAKSQENCGVEPVFTIHGRVHRDGAGDDRRA